MFYRKKGIYRIYIEWKEFKFYNVSVNGWKNFSYINEIFVKYLFIFFFLFVVGFWEFWIVFKYKVYLLSLVLY